MKKTSNICKNLKQWGLHTTHVAYKHILCILGQDHIFFNSKSFNAVTEQLTVTTYNIF